MQRMLKNLRKTDAKYVGNSLTPEIRASTTSPLRNIHKFLYFVNIAFDQIIGQSVQSLRTAQLSPQLNTRR